MAEVSRKRILNTCPDCTNFIVSVNDFEGTFICEICKTEWKVEVRKLELPSDA